MNNRSDELLVRKIAYLISLIGLSLSLIIHIASLLRLNLNEIYSFAYVLHIVVVIVWIPTTIIYNKRLKNNNKKKSNRPSTRIVIKSITQDAPEILSLIAFVAFIYSLINFAIFMDSGVYGTINEVNGKYELLSHGEFIKELSIWEVNRYRITEIRGFSGHWITFYLWAMVVLYPWKKKLVLSNKK